MAKITISGNKGFNNTVTIEFDSMQEYAENADYYDDVYIRMVSAALTKSLSRCITWINYFEDKKHKHFYYLLIKKHFQSLCLTLFLYNRHLGNIIINISLYF